MPNDAGNVRVIVVCARIAMENTCLGIKREMSVVECVSYSAD